MNTVWWLRLLEHDEIWFDFLHRRPTALARRAFMPTARKFIDFIRFIHSDTLGAHFKLAPDGFPSKRKYSENLTPVSVLRSYLLEKISIDLTQRPPHRWSMRCFRRSRALTTRNKTIDEPAAAGSYVFRCERDYLLSWNFTSPGEILYRPRYKFTRECFPEGRGVKLYTVNKHGHTGTADPRRYRYCYTINLRQVKSV